MAHDLGPRDLQMTTLASPDGDLVARFAPGAGMVCASLTHRGDELLGLRGGVEAYLERGTTFGIPLLYPWANRLGGWDYTISGRTVPLDAGSGLLRPDEHGVPIHGLLARWLPWRVAGTGADTAAWLDAELDWAARPDLLGVFPFAHRVGMGVRVEGDTVRFETTVQATGGDPVPLSFGFHPYVVPPGAPRASWEVELPALTHLALDARGLPTGEREARPAETFVLGRRTFDDLFAVGGETPRFAVSDGARRLVVEFDAGFPYAQVFAPPDQDVICFEPMTAPVDALRTHDGLRLVAPGTSTSATFALRVETVRGRPTEHPRTAAV